MIWAAEKPYSPPQSDFSAELAHHYLFIYSFFVSCNYNTSRNWAYAVHLLKCYNKPNLFFFSSHHHLTSAHGKRATKQTYPV